MALRIRMARGGTKKRPFYRIVVADSRSPRDGRFIERIGSYNPMLPKDHPDRVMFDLDRAKHWMTLGATPSERIARFLGKAGVIDPPKIAEQTQQHLPKAKAQERLKELEEKKTAAAAAAAEAAAAPVEEAPAEEAPAEEAPAEEAPAEEAKTEETPAAETPTEEAPAEETPKEDAPAEDEKKEG